MTHRAVPDLDEPQDASVHTHAAAFYFALIEAGHTDEASDFAAWYVEAFDYDLED